MINLLLEVDCSKFLLLFMLFGFCSGNVQFQPNDTPCLGQFQEYQCNVSEGVGLIWRVRDSSDMAVGGTVTYNSDEIGADATAGQFLFEQLEHSPNIISNVSFTVQSSIDGYSIQCRRQGTSINETIVIKIPGIPNSPSDVNVIFTNTSVNISWTDLSSLPCFNVYRYNISSINRMESTTSNNVLVDELELFDEEYCVIVTAVDTANRNSSGSDPVCFIFNVPPSVGNLNVTNNTESDTTVEVVVEWTGISFDVTDEIIVPDILGYTVTIVNSTDPNDYSNASGLLSPLTTQYTFTGVPKGRTYNISVIAVNVVGNSIPSYETINVRGPFVVVVPTSSSTSGTQTSTSFTTSSTITTSTISPSGTTSPVNPTPGSSSSGDLPLPAIVGAIIGAIILILVIVIIVIVVIIIYKKMKSEKSDGVDLTSDKRGNHGDPIPLVQKHMPETGQAALYQDPDTIKRQEAPTGDMYALPDRGSKRRPPPAGPELATYQDPDTIMRQAAPTGDLYAQPDKKPMYSEVNKQAKAAGGMYAELDHMTPNSPSERPLLNSDFQQPPQVVYSAVKH